MFSHPKGHIIYIVFSAVFGFEVAEIMLLFAMGIWLRQDDMYGWVYAYL